MNNFEYYLLIINIVGFLIYLLNMWLYTHTANGQIDKLLTLFALAGSSAGILTAILLFDRKAVKKNMMSRVFIACVFVIQLIIFLMLNGHHTEIISFDFKNFFIRHKGIYIYLIVINLVTFAAFAIDKFNAIHHRSRIRIVTLLGLSFVGGSIGGLVAMYLLHHKTKKDYFTTGVPLIMIMQIVVLFYAINTGW